jgi:hypothetical protein
MYEATIQKESYVAFSQQHRLGEPASMLHRTYIDNAVYFLFFLLLPFYSSVFFLFVDHLPSFS